MINLLSLVSSVRPHQAEPCRESRAIDTESAFETSSNPTAKKGKKLERALNEDIYLLFSCVFKDCL